jgi:hypothetical protein
VLALGLQRRLPRKVLAVLKKADIDLLALPHKLAI